MLTVTGAVVDVSTCSAVREICAEHFAERPSTEDHKNRTHNAATHSLPHKRAYHSSARKMFGNLQARIMAAVEATFAVQLLSTVHRSSSARS